MKIVDKCNNHYDAGRLGKSGATPSYHPHHLKCPECGSTMWTEAGDTPKRIQLCSMFMEKYVIWIDVCPNCGYDKIAYSDDTLVDVLVTGMQGGTQEGNFWWIMKNQEKKFLRQMYAAIGKLLEE